MMHSTDALGSHDTCFGSTMQRDEVAQVEQQAKDFIQDLDGLLGERTETGMWLFGDQPTILDAHATTFIARLTDVERFDLLTETVQRYAGEITKTKEWHAVTHGRRTVWKIEYGHAADLNPL